MKIKDSLSQDVYNEILKRLLDGRIIPGTMLNRRDVAGELGVSVAPVLEAMLRLEIEGFLESIPRKGSFVKTAQRDDIFGQLMVREALECQAVRFYCGKKIAENSKALLKSAEQLDNNVRLKSLKGWEKEIQFHLSLIDLAGCPTLSKTFIKTMQLGLFFQLNQIINEQPHPESKHFDLVEKLCAASPNSAEQIIRSHLRSGKNNLFILDKIK